MRFFLTFLFSIPFQLYSGVVTIPATTVTVSAFQSLIDKAGPGDTILLSAGTYTVSEIIINKPILFQGVGMPVMDGKKSGNVLSVRSSFVTIKGIHIRNSGFSGYNDPAGIKIENTKGVTVTDCVVENCYFGIYYANSTDGLIRGNKVTANKLTETSSGNGIHLWKCSGIGIRGNYVKGHRDGIYLEFATNAIISGNLSEGNIRYGLHFMFSHNDAYIRNTFRNNGAGVAVMYTKNVQMLHNVFIDNRGTTSYGLLLKDITDSRISNNSFDNNTCAITMEECNRIHVYNNNFRSNGWAIRIQASCSDNTIESNNFIGNTFDITTNGTMVMNTFNRNYWDKYTGYDLNRDKTGDVPYLPVSMYAVIVDQIPISMILFRSFVVTLLEQMEKIIPSITPAQLVDQQPRMKPVHL